MIFLQEVDPADAPLVIWLQGGPGGSAMFGLFELHGPIEAVFGNGGDVEARMRDTAWTRVANMIYVDNPVGTGYSYTDPGQLRNEIGQVNDDLYEFMQQFLTVFEEYQVRLKPALTI